MYLDELVRYVILGNHRDAWTFGAVDPNSGTAVLLEASLSFPRHVRWFMFSNCCIAMRDVETSVDCTKTR